MSNVNETVISVKDLTRWYIQKKVTKQDGKTSKKQIIKAVDGVSFELKQGKHWALSVNLDVVNQHWDVY